MCTPIGNYWNLYFCIFIFNFEIFIAEFVANIITILNPFKNHSHIGLLNCCCKFQHKFEWKIQGGRYNKLFSTIIVYENPSTQFVGWFHTTSLYIECKLCASSLFIILLKIVIQSQIIILSLACKHQIIIIILRDIRELLEIHNLHFYATRTSCWFRGLVTYFIKNVSVPRPENGKTYRKPFRQTPPRN